MSIRKWYARLSASERVIFFSGLGFCLFLLWASLAQVDEVTRGQGRVIPSSKVQLIQAAEPSTISTILVRSGQAVKKGQLLVRLDDTSSSSELGQLSAETNRLSERADRLNREGGGGSGGCSGENCAYNRCGDRHCVAVYLPLTQRLSKDGATIPKRKPQ
jgi:membrane fusion protein, adhesin transport system